MEPILETGRLLLRRFTGADLELPSGPGCFGEAGAERRHHHDRQHRLPAAVTS